MNQTDTYKIRAIQTKNQVGKAKNEKFAKNDIFSKNPWLLVGAETELELAVLKLY